MKHLIHSIGILAFAGILFLAPALVFAENGTSSSVTGSIEVTGSAIVDMPPDLATLRFTVRSVGNSSQESIAMNKEKTESIKNALQQASVGSSDITVKRGSTYSSRVYSDVKGDTSQTITGYTTTQNYNLVVKNADSIPDIVDVLAGREGVSGVGAINLGVKQLNFTVTADGATARGALDSLNNVVRNIKAALVTFGISSKDFIMSSHQLFPKYRYSPREQKEFITTSTVIVKLRMIDSAAAVEEAAIAAGAEGGGGPSLSLSSTKNTYKLARKKAFADAREKAEEIAVLAGLKLGSVKSVKETSRSTDEIFLGKGGSIYDETGSRSIRVPANLTIEFFAEPIVEVK